MGYHLIFIPNSQWKHKPKWKRMRDHFRGIQSGHMESHDFPSVDSFSSHLSMVSRLLNNINTNHSPEIEPIHTEIKLIHSSIAVRGFCQNCCSPLFMKYHCRPDLTRVALGTVDESSVVGGLKRVEEHVFFG